MKNANLKSMTVDQLVARFAEIGVAQYRALDDHEDWIENNPNLKFNRLFNQMNEVDLELRSRGREARLALQRLYVHPNIQVRLKAAKRTLAVAPDVARQVIETIADSQWYPQAGEAGMTLFALDDGIFKPD
jgi:hypothetical protein